MKKYRNIILLIVCAIYLIIGLITFSIKYYTDLWHNSSFEIIIDVIIVLGISFGVLVCCLSMKCKEKDIITKVLLFVLILLMVISLITIIVLPTVRKISRSGVSVFETISGNNFEYEDDEKIISIHNGQNVELPLLTVQFKESGKTYFGYIKQSEYNGDIRDVFYVFDTNNENLALICVEPILGNRIVVQFIINSFDEIPDLDFGSYKLYLAS